MSDDQLTTLMEFLHGEHWTGWYLTQERSHAQLGYIITLQCPHVAAPAYTFFQSDLAFVAINTANLQANVHMFTLHLHEFALQSKRHCWMEHGEHELWLHHMHNVGKSLKSWKGFTIEDVRPLVMPTGAVKMQWHCRCPHKELYVEVVTPKASTATYEADLLSNIWAKCNLYCGGALYEGANPVRSEIKDLNYAADVIAGQLIQVSIVPSGTLDVYSHLQDELAQWTAEEVHYEGFKVASTEPGNADPMDLRAVFPDLKRRVLYPCGCTKGLAPYSGSVWLVIQHLNDVEKWPREAIADWLERLEQETGLNFKMKATQKGD